MDNSNQELILKDPRGKRGLIFKVVIDDSSSGFWFKKSNSNNMWTLCLWYISINISLMSEEKLNLITSIATIQEKCESHQIEFRKENSVNILKIKKNNET